MARIAKRVTQQQLADLIHKTRPLISHIEQTGKVHHDTYRKICKVLNVSEDEMSKVGDPHKKYMAYPDEVLRALKSEVEALARENRTLSEYNTLLKNQLDELQRKLSKKKK